MKLSIKDFFSKCEQITFTEEILNGKLHFLCSVSYALQMTMMKKLIYFVIVMRWYLSSKSLGFYLTSWST